MSTTDIQGTSTHRISLWTMVLFSASAVACMRNVDVSKIKCAGDSTCPNGYSCSPLPGKDYGACIPGPRNADADRGDQALPTPFDGPAGLDGQATDGRPIDGPRGSADTTIVDGSAAGTGGAALGGSSGVGGVTGSGGVSSQGGVGATGGVSSQGGAGATGGTTGDAGRDAPLTLANGSPCTTDAQCTDGHCIDGVCCDSKCDGQCQACNESSSPGHCVAVQGAPRGQRAACTGTAPCKGQCATSNPTACTFPGSSTVCTAQICTAGSATPASVCNGAGVCTSPASTPCSTNLCSSDGTKCSDSCSGTSCPAGYYCAISGACTKKSDLGTTCTSKDECSSGFCADGVCCQSACTGQCQVCSASGACTRVSSGGPRSGHTPCTTTDATCAGSCDGTSDSCVYKGSETACSTASCASVTVLNNAKVCNGQGACGSAQQTDCALSGQYCSTNKCTATLGDGGSCTSSAQCTNANCTGGMCCGAGQTGCSGSCVNLSTSTANCGACGTPCPSGQSCCGGSCKDLNNNNADCGSCGHSCGAQVCMTGACCDATSVNCGGACCDPNHTCSGSSCACQGYAFSCGGCSAWNFETNTTEGWVKTPTSLGGDHVVPNGITGFAPSMYQPSQGTHTLAVSVSTNSTNNMAAFAVPLCPATGAAVSVPANIKVTASMYFSTNSGSWDLFSAELYGPTGYQGAVDPNFSHSASGRITFQMSFPTATTASYLAFYFVPGAAWTGTIYVDEVKLSM